VRGFLKRTVLKWVERAGRLAHKHGLDPRVFVFLALLGYVIQGLYYIPWFKGKSIDLGFLVFLRFLGVVGPFYILIKGKQIAAVVNASLAVSWTLNTAWQVCHFVYL